MKKLIRIGILVFALVFLAVACTNAPASNSTSATSASATTSAASASVSAEITEKPKESPSVPESASGSGYPVEVTDLMGADVTIEGSDRIVSLTPSSTEILIAEGAEGRIVGTDAYSPEIAGAEICGDYNGPDVEKIVSLEPDVVISGNDLQQDAIDQMRSLGLRIVSAEATTWDQIPESYTLIGKVIGAEDIAADLCTQLDEIVKTAEMQKPAETPTVYYVLSFGDAGNWTSGLGSFINSMIGLAGGKCITDGETSAWLEYPIENLAAADPDCIIFSSGAGSYEDLIKAPGYADLSAVRNGRVYEIDADLVSRPGPDIGQALLSISSILNNEVDQTEVPSSEETTTATASADAA